jgi:hypothetical protein
MSAAAVAMDGRGRGRGRRRGWRRALAEKLRHASLRRSVEVHEDAIGNAREGGTWKDALVLFVAAKLKQVEFERDRDPLFSAGSRRRVPRGLIANAQFRVVQGRWRGDGSTVRRVTGAQGGIRQSRRWKANGRWWSGFSRSKKILGGLKDEKRRGSQQTASRRIRSQEVK